MHSFNNIYVLLTHGLRRYFQYLVHPNISCFYKNRALAMHGFNDTYVILTHGLLWHRLYSHS